MIFNWGPQQIEETSLIVVGVEIKEVFIEYYVHLFGIMVYLGLECSPVGCFITIYKKQQLSFP